VFEKGERAAEPTNRVEQDTGAVDTHCGGVGIRGQDSALQVCADPPRRRRGRRANEDRERAGTSGRHVPRKPIGPPSLAGPDVEAGRGAHR
jgi:hypothetical protein